ncbi:DNA polymerase III subunit beta [Aetokthonos hydrillicola Thurmond2011]|jgi:DNA polymerase-3 subunit beta|uniref:DNA polymerase III subunit beta n=1 Tax=Aetokthonos hydrillicola Thurmond2011 TaxID=2712845 RepID=A0AAP5IDQ2_9CYAN|nr:DNA polymerase III subunit beta [Aetokthonos hydrillicola]MBO3458458.1 DNA polymerase III subunit beta [Aetokthonos hydrillicola CCALA 1050]MBW4586215.1 DNA polymerase III subunit beta [Aetokthonos hydrillicola CCALA 1050]MDR9897823.1 DNA polymerase III subunit beta [Aetokthonos hydrillicola Thurmond2011]
MKIKIPQKDFANTLSQVNLAVPSKPHHPILNNLLLYADKHKQLVVISAFDMSLGIRAECKCSVDDGGTIALPAKLLSQLVSSLPKGDIILEVLDNSAVLSHSTGKCRVQAANPQEFPPLPEANGTSITLSASKLLQALEATLFAASLDETKFVLAGVHFKFARTHWEAAATDGHRLGVACGTLELNENTESAFDPDLVEMTIPHQTLTELQKILGSVGENSECKISLDNRIAVFDLPSFRITSRLIEGEYPKYSSLIPQQFQHQFTIDRKALDNILKRVGIFADQKEKVVAITFDYSNQQANLCTQYQDVGGAVESISIKSKGDQEQKLHIGFNIKYLSDALKFIPTDEVLIQANLPTTPVIITPVGGILNHLILVMPLQLIAAEEDFLTIDPLSTTESMTDEDISTANQQTSSTFKETLVTDEEAPSTTEIAAEVALVMAKSVLEGSSQLPEVNTNPQVTENITTATHSPTTPTTQTKGRKKKPKAAA